MSEAMTTHVLMTGGGFPALVPGPAAITRRRARYSLRYSRVARPAFASVAADVSQATRACMTHKRSSVRVRHGPILVTGASHLFCRGLRRFFGASESQQDKRARPHRLQIALQYALQSEPRFPASGCGTVPSRASACGCFPKAEPGPLRAGLGFSHCRRRRSSRAGGGLPALMGFASRRRSSRAGGGFRFARPLFSSVRRAGFVFGWRSSSGSHQFGGGFSVVRVDGCRAAYKAAVGYCPGRDAARSSPLTGPGGFVPHFAAGVGGEVSNPSPVLSRRRDYTAGGTGSAGGPRHPPESLPRPGSPPPFLCLSSFSSARVRLDRGGRDL